MTSLKRTAENTLETPRQDLGRAGTRLAWLVALFIVLWCGFYACWRIFPFLETGSEVMYKSKLQALSQQRLLDPEARYRVVMCGSSISLSGFIPDLFDRLFGQGCRSYNMGLPERNDYMPVIREMIKNGDRPTHLLLQVPWPNRIHPESFLEKFKSDDFIMNGLFPFRKLPRDLAIFAVLSRQNGGFKAYYEAKKQTVEQMLKDRGYYFIEGQSRYPDHRLPEGVTFQTDKPDKVKKRRVSTQSLAFKELRELAETHNIKILLMPAFYRANYLAEPPAHNTAVADVLADFPRFHVLGPDYFRYGNRYFSDSLHVNREGAERYTKQIYDLFNDFIRTQVKTDQGGD